MKRFIFSILCVSVFFVGVGTLIEKTGAAFKSDEKALDLVRKSRQAIGGDAAIGAVESLRIVGRTTQTIKVNGVDKTEQGETEIALQLPDKLMKMFRFGHGDEKGAGAKFVSKQVDVVVAGKGEGRGIGTGVEPGHKITITKKDGTTGEVSGGEGDEVIVRRVDGDKKVWTAEGAKTVTVDANHVFVKGAGDHHGAMKHNEMLRLTLGLLLTAPQGIDVNYTYGGEGDVDGASCNIVIAEFGGQSFKLYLGKSSNLPVMMSYAGYRMPKMAHFNKEIAPPTDGAKDIMIFRKSEGQAPEKAEFNVRFSDYRSVGGVQLPYKWTQTIGGAADETFDVTSYEINPANIAEKFQNQKVLVRSKKPSDN